MSQDRWISFDLHSAPRAPAADAVPFEGDDTFDAKPGWGEIVVTAAMTAGALLLVSLFALVIATA